MTTPHISTDRHREEDQQEDKDSENSVTCTPNLTEYSH